MELQVDIGPKIKKYCMVILSHVLLLQIHSNMNIIKYSPKAARVYNHLNIKNKSNSHAIVMVTALLVILVEPSDTRQ